MEKTEIPGIYKESEGILINVDNEALAKYKKKRMLRKNQVNRINTLEYKVSELSEDIKEIKSLLKELVNR